MNMDVLTGEDGLRRAATRGRVLQAGYLVGLLLVINIFNSIDRQILGLLGEGIKHDLALADWQLGLLTGLAFALFYSILGIPIARLSDRFSRGRIIALCLTIWSFCTALSALAQSFAHLLLMRVCVGIGEAGCNPAAHSLISDYVRPERRSLAMSIYSVGLPLGILLGLSLGGLIAQTWGWRATLAVAGTPGIVLALIVLLSLRDPLRVADKAAVTAQPAAGDIFKELRGSRTYWRIALAMTSIAFIQSALQTFAAPMFLRNHSAGLDRIGSVVSRVTGLEMQHLGVIGLVLGVMSGLAGAIGMLVGGALGDRLGRDDPRGHLAAPIVASLLSVPVLLVASLSSDIVIALLFWGLALFLLLLPTGPAFALVQEVAPRHGRAMAVAILMLIMNLFGAGSGPLVAGAISDLIHSVGGADAGIGLRYALAGISFLAVLTGWFFWKACDHIRTDALANRGAMHTQLRQ